MSILSRQNFEFGGIKIFVPGLQEFSDDLLILAEQLFLIMILIVL